MARPYAFTPEEEIRDMYNRYQRDLSDELFNSVYSDLYRLAESEQAAIWKAAKYKSDYRTGEALENLTAFCKGKLSLGHALDFINSSKAGRSET